MKRRLATAMAAALLAFAAADGAFDAGAQTPQAPEAAARKAVKAVQQSCPVHPEVKARSAGKCPKCRAEQRKVKNSREKQQNKAAQAQQQQQGNAVNE